MYVEMWVLALLGFIFILMWGVGVLLCAGLTIAVKNDLTWAHWAGFLVWFITFPLASVVQVIEEKRK